MDRSQAPSPGPIRPFHFPDVTKGKLENGLELRTSRLSRLPLATVALVLRAGEGALDASRAGLAVLSGDALEGGTTHRSGIELAEALEGIGATLGIGTGWEGTTVSMSCLADRLDEAMALLAELTLQSDFPEPEIDRLKAQRIASIRQRSMDPGSLASDAAARLFFAEGHPYGRPLGGSLDSVEAITPTAARGFVEARFSPKTAGLVAVGDLDTGEVEELARKHLGHWDWVSEAAETAAPQPRSRERRIVVVDRPGAVQSELRVGHMGASKSSPDFFALAVMNTILGGSFTSRLNLNLREKNGFTYGVRSRFSFRRQPGPFTVSTAVGTDQTADAVRETFFEVERYLADGPTDEEFTAAQDYLAGIFPLQLETTGQIASRIAEVLVHDLPEDYHHTYRDRIRGVDRLEGLEAMRRNVRPEEMTVVVVGDAESVKGPLEALELGPVHVESSEG